MITEHRAASPSPSDATILRVLRDGYWDRTELIRLSDGSMRVRKASKGAQAGPWGQDVLRREMQYLSSLTGPAADYFPRVLAAWDDGQTVGYEMSYIDQTRDAGAIVQAAELDQTKSDRFQDTLGTIVFDHLHIPVPDGPSLSAHVRETLTYALESLLQEAPLAPLIQATTIRVNAHPMSGTRQAVQRICDPSGPLSLLDAGPRVRLHGDCFLENILVPNLVSDPQWPARLILIDPVSVAGIYQGHPMFDLIKYESYATGELLALRSGLVNVDGFDQPLDGNYTYQIRWDEPALRPFTRIDWHSRFRATYLKKYPAIHMPMYRLLEGYFALVMSVCTRGAQRRARLLRATMALNAAAGLSAAQSTSRSPVPLPGQLPPVP